MALANPDFGALDDKDPFVRAFRKIDRKVDGHMQAYSHATFHDHMIDITRRRIVAVSRVYFANDFLQDDADDGRTKALRDGLVVGFMVGRLAVPLMTRYGYYRYVQEHVYPDSEVFRGYHFDSSSLSDIVDERYARIKDMIQIPEEKVDETEEVDAYVAGIGYMATLCARFRDTLRWPYLGNMVVRDAHSAQIERTRKQLERPDTQISIDEITKHE